MIGYVKFGRVNVFMSRIVAEVNILSRFGVTYSPTLCIPATWLPTFYIAKLSRNFLAIQNFWKYMPNPKKQFPNLLTVTEKNLYLGKMEISQQKLHCVKNTKHIIIRKCKPNDTVHKSYLLHTRNITVTQNKKSNKIRPSMAIGVE